ncbi:site-specific integrase [Citricoccus sp. I39-566]|uniref:tyrosine-type recombinase/integrase n=1 Tax=Citricoccus sp. I39-566 TaxID=3073268 RepID=UPI00286C99FA|nr:site-specific integrase [Citricoccus sp. I39-566]WMY79471.1 site-specific integrase [Citricoccus sp. I39-566]
MAEGLIRDNPAKAARLPRRDELDEDPAELAALDAETIREVCKALQAYQARTRVAMWGGGPRYTDVWILLAGSGARIGEVLALRLMDALVDEKRMAISGTMTENGKVQRQSTTKSRRKRTVPVSSEAAAVMKRRLAEGIQAGLPMTAPLVPSTSGGWWPPTAFRRGLRDALGHAGIDQDRVDDEGRLVHISPHGLRRRVITDIWDEYGVERAARHAGHSTPRITMTHYVRPPHETPEADRALPDYFN